MQEKSLAEKQDLLRKYALGLEEIWKRLVDEGEEMGDPLALFEPAIALCERSLAKLMSD